MKKLFIWGLLLLLLLAGCSSNKGERASDSAGAADGAKSSATENAAKADYANKSTTNQEENTTAAVIKTTNRMVIYNADLRLEVKDFKKSQKVIEELVNNMAGYIVQAEIYDNEEGRMGGTITARIPQKNFQSFLEQAENISVKVHNRNISGQDVTEEYVDLEARLKSKRVVEERLISFMKEAKETKDLLQISQDLERVQQEIESIEGRMKYLENQTAMSTVTLTLFENKVDIPGIEKEELNTWDKTKKQFMDSINFLLAAISGLIVFLIGNSPILILLVIVGFITWHLWKKYKNKQE